MKKKYKLKSDVFDIILAIIIILLILILQNINEARNKELDSKINRLEDTYKESIECDKEMVAISYMENGEYRLVCVQENTLK